MQDALNNLIALLYLVKLDERTFQGESLNIDTGRVYGGQVLGQALKAAQNTVTQGKTIHSMHAYFMREGDHSIPITYHVDISRDGRSFSTRRVIAIQQNRPIFITDASFQIEEEGLKYQPQMPEVIGPDSLISFSDYEKDGDNKISDRLHNLIKLTAPFDVKPVKTKHLKSNAKNNTISTFVWIKTTHTVEDDPDIHRAILAYISDYGLVATSLVPHGLDFDSQSLQLASIDHGMWFHRPFRIDEWLLYACEPVSTSNARGLSRGSFYDQNGNMIATTMQEGLIRQIKKGGDPPFF